MATRWQYQARWWTWLLGCWILCASMTAKAASDAQILEQATQIVQASRAPGGVISVVGATDARLALALARQGSFVVHCLCPNSATCDTVRKEIRANGRYGTVSAMVLEAATLPYANNLVNLVVALKPGKIPVSELLRVTAPLGNVLVGTQAKQLAAGLKTAGATELKTASSQTGFAGFTKPYPANMDQWTHYLHGPDCNPVALDQVVGPPQHYQWVGGPAWLRCHETDSSISTLVTAQGRLFAIVDEAPISLVGPQSPPDKWSLVARDAFNGVELWKIPIRRWGWREWKSTWFNTRPGDIPLNIQKRLVAVGDKVYVTLGYQAPVSELDARTGTILKTFAGTERTGEILCLDGKLMLSILENGLVKVQCVDIATGKALWTSRKAYRGSTTDYIKWKEMNGGGDAENLDPALNLSTDGKFIAFIDGPEIVCLDAQTGAEKWHSTFPQDDADKKAGGIQSDGNLWIGTMIVHDGVVVHASPNKLAGLSAATGKVLWEQPKKYIGHLWYEWKDVFLIADLVWTWGADLETGTLEGGGKKDRSVYPKTVFGYDLKTGAIKKQVPLGTIFKANHHHRCYRNKATELFILASRRGTEFVDLKNGQHTVDNWVRSTCHVGMMPANGLQYVPPHPCQCYIDEKLNGFLALGPSRPDEDAVFNSKTPRREKGPAYVTTATGAAADPTQDWPTYRKDMQRSGATKMHMPDHLKLAWQTRIGSQVTPPTVVGDRLFVALPEEHHVVCLSTLDGTKLWEFATGGRVDSPPTYHQGIVFFGSADGWVYAVQASDGQLAWRFRGTPGDRLIGAYDQLESSWPVSGSVLVMNDTAYFAAGRTTQLEGGIRLYGLDAITGELRHQQLIEGPRYNVNTVEANNKLPMGGLPDILMADAGKIYMRAQTFNYQLKPDRGQAEMLVKGGFLDGTYFKRAPWTFGAQNNYGSLLVHNEESVCFVRMFDSMRGLDPTVFFTPGSKGYQVFAQNKKTGKDSWLTRMPVRIRAMALADNRLLVAGPPDVIDPKDPLGAFEGRKGGILAVVDTASGNKLSEIQLPSPPVFNGVAAARGQCFLSAEDGSVMAFGKK